MRINTVPRALGGRFARLRRLCSSIRAAVLFVGKLCSWRMRGFYARFNTRFVDLCIRVRGRETFRQ